MVTIDWITISLMYADTTNTYNKIYLEGESHFFFQPGPDIVMFWCVNDSYSAKVLESVQEIDSAGSHNAARMAANQSIRATLTVQVINNKIKRCH